MMSKKKKKKHPVKKTVQKKRKSHKTTAVILLGIAVIALGLLLWTNRTTEDGPVTDNSQQGNSETLPSILPCTIENDKLEVISLFQFSGTNPDSNDEDGEDIASLTIKNQSTEHLTEAEITAYLSNGESVKFMVKDVPAGKTVNVFSSENKSYALKDNCTTITSQAKFEAETPIMADKLSIEVNETTIQITNISDEELTNLNVICHCLFDDAYFGGSTYSYPIEKISANETVTIEADECYLGQAEVVRINESQ